MLTMSGGWRRPPRRRREHLRRSSPRESGRHVPEHCRGLKLQASRFFEVGGKLRDLLFAAFLSAAVFLVYQPAWQGGLIWDDAGHLTRPELQSWQGLYRIWSEVGATQQYYPLLHSVFWLQHRLWGDATLGYHLVNILLHLVAALLVALVLRRLAVPGAYLAATVFALHPVHVESVAWISELKNTLSAVFYLGALVVYLHFDRTRKVPWYLFAGALFLLGLLSKTVTATLPGALLVVFWWRRGRLSWRSDVLPLLPLFSLGAVAGTFTAWVERTLIGAEGALFDLGVLERFLLAGRALWFYAGKLFFPVDLLFMYPRWELDPAVWWQYLFPAAALLLAGSLWLVRHRWRAPLAGLLFFAGSLFPVLGFFNVYPFIYSFVADHFQYLASLGLITPASAGLALALGRKRPRERAVGHVVCLVLLAGLAGLTWRQSRMYTDIESLYRATIKGNPASWMAYTNLGTLLAERGQVAEAIALFRKTIEIAPDFAKPYYNLGIVLADHGRLDEAIFNYQKALEVHPYNAEIHNNLGNALAARGRLEEAVAHYRRALRLVPDDAYAHYNLALALASSGGGEEAITHLQRALAVRPDFTKAREALANTQRYYRGR